MMRCVRGTRHDQCARSKVAAQAFEHGPWIGEVFENLTGNENIKATKRLRNSEIFNVRSIHRINVPRRHGGGFREKFNADIAAAFSLLFGVGTG